MRERNDWILADMIAARAEQKPDLDVLTFEHLSLDGGATADEVRTYADLHTNANRIAAALVRHGMERGDRFGLMMRNHPEYVESMIAASITACVFVPIDPRTRGEKLAYMLRNAGCRGVICADYCLAEVTRVRKDAPEVGWLLGLETGEGPEAVPLGSEAGVASWYGPGFAGKPTASGEIYNPNHLTAAHKTLPLGTLVRVYNVENDREMIVRINDRGPFVRGRVIDLSSVAAEVLGFRDDGLAQVELTLVRTPKTRNVGEAFRDTVARAANAGRSAIFPAKSTSDRQTHVFEAAAGSPTLPTHTTETAAEYGITDDGVNGFFIQVGAFRDGINAQELIQRIKDLGMSPGLRESDNVVRVLVGPFQERASAMNAQLDLERAGINGFLRTSGR
jgi:rare lipoprotein A